MHLDMVSQAVAADASGESFAGGRFNFDGVNLAETVVAASSGEGDRPDPVEGASFKNAGGFGEADGRMQPVERLDFGRAGVVGEEELGALLRCMGMGFGFESDIEFEGEPRRMPAAASDRRVFFPTEQGASQGVLQAGNHEAGGWKELRWGQWSRLRGRGRRRFRVGSTAAAGPPAGVGRGRRSGWKGCRGQAPIDTYDERTHI